MKMSGRDTVAIGWLSPGEVDNGFAMALATLYRERPQIVALFTDENSGLLSRGRNLLVANFLEQCDAEWLLMIDSDEQLSLEGFDKLYAAAQRTVRPIVAGLYFGAWRGEFYPTAVPLIFKAIPGTSRFLPIQQYPRDEVIEIDSAGTGCLMVNRNVFEKIRDDSKDLAQHHGGRWCWFQDMPVNGDWFSEDHFFCARAREVGFKLHAHTGVVLPHRKKFWLDERHHLMSHPDMLTPEERRSPRWAPLTGETPDRELEAAALERPKRKQPVLAPVPKLEAR